MAPTSTTHEVMKSITTTITMYEILYRVNSTDTSILLIQFLVTFLFLQLVSGRIVCLTLHKLRYTNEIYESHFFFIYM